MDLYSKNKKGGEEAGQAREFSFEIGLKIVLGAAKGLAYMHSMPKPVVHRDIKSGNIMIMKDGITGKLGDCGESRRVTLDSTMTQTGTPLWAAPELLRGERYDEMVDIFSFGIVLYEIATRKLPYSERRKTYQGKHLDRQMMKDIANGRLTPTLEPKTRRRYRIGRGFWQLFKLCTKHQERERPAMEEVVEGLKEILTARTALPTGVSSPKRATVTGKKLKSTSLPTPDRSASSFNSDLLSRPWGEEGSRVSTALETFISRLKSQAVGGSFRSVHEQVGLLQELHEQVEEVLGKDAVAPSSGVFNVARLYRYLRVNPHPCA